MTVTFSFWGGHLHADYSRVCDNLSHVCHHQDLNQKWTKLQEVTQERANQLGSAHEVQRFHRDVDETVDWIQEKDEALNNDDCGTPAGPACPNVYTLSHLALTQMRTYCPSNACVCKVYSNYAMCITVFSATAGLGVSFSTCECIILLLFSFIFAILL